MNGLGDIISSVATPVARVIGADCIDKTTGDLRPESPCAKAKEDLNMGVPIWDVFYDRFWGTKAVDETIKTGESEILMEYVVNKTTTELISVDAESIDEAEEKAAKGEGTTISRNKSFNSRPRTENTKTVDSRKLKPPVSPTD